MFTDALASSEKKGQPASCFRKRLQLLCLQYVWLGVTMMVVATVVAMMRWLRKSRSSHRGHEGKQKKRFFHTAIVAFSTRFLSIAPKWHQPSQVIGVP